MKVRDYYAVLGVKGQTSEVDTKKASRRLARQRHPDANPKDRQTRDSSSSRQPSRRGSLMVADGIEIPEEPDRREGHPFEVMSVVGGKRQT